MTDSSTTPERTHQARIDAPTSIADNYSQTDKVVDVIAKYTPSMISRSRWATVAEFTRSAVTDFAPRNRTEARDALFAVGRVADWTHHVAGHRLDRQVVFNPRNIDDFVRRGYPVAQDVRKATIRHYLHRISGELGFGDEARRRARKLQEYDHRAPYTGQEFADFRMTARTASTDKRQHDLLTALALAAGFGLQTNEVLEASPNDVVADDRGVVISVRGSAAREVVCLPEWEEDVLAVVKARTGKRYLLDIESVTPTLSENLAGHLSRMVGRNQAFTIERLRTSWIVRHLNAGTSPQIILRGLGVNTTRPIERCLRYLATPTDADYFTALRVGGSK